MSQPSLVLVALAGVLGGAVRPAAACTTVCLRGDGRVVFGKNYDWNVEDGMLVVNKRGATHRAAATTGTSPASWVARYGSVTFNQYGRDQPMGGMNEAGLVIEVMWAEGSRYPATDARPAVGCLEWIQLQLDTSATVAEVLASDAKVRIESATPLHFLVADRRGEVATFELIDGKLVAHTGDSLPVAALTNNFYRESVGYRTGLSGRLPGGVGSLPRFARAADRVQRFRSGDAVAYAFATLEDVHQPSTQWRIVYEVDRAKIHFRTRSHPAIRTLSLDALDFSCATPVLIADLAAEAPGGHVAFVPYSRAANLRLIRSSFAQTDFLASTPPAELERMAALPDSSRCELPAR